MQILLLGALSLISTVVGVGESAFSIFWNVTAWSPPVYFDAAYWGADSATGAFTTGPAAETDGRPDGLHFLWMIGTHLVPYGTVRHETESAGRSGSMKYRWGEQAGAGGAEAPLLDPFPETGVLAHFGRIQLGSYYIELYPANNTVTIEYIIIEVPIFTRAPSEETLRAGAQTSRAVEANQLNSSSFEIRQYQSHKYSHLLSQKPAEPLDPTPPALYDVVNGSIALLNLTEVTYSVPPNTSLINITGPTYPHDHTGCYMLLEPEPWWWNGDVVPLVAPWAPDYRPDQTLWMIPVDPSVEYQVIIGASSSYCTITAITTYSYTAITTYSFNEPNAFSTSAVTVSAAPEQHSETPAPAEDPKTTNAGAIAGGVVGGVAALLLVALAAVYVRRRRGLSQGRAPPSIVSAFASTEEVQVIVPFAAPSRPIDDAPGATAHSLLRAEESAPGNDPAAAELAAGQTDSSGTTHSVAKPARRAEDMEDAEEDQLLPPGYKEAWGRRHSAEVEDAGGAKLL